MWALRTEQLVRSHRLDQGMGSLGLENVMRPLGFPHRVRPLGLPDGMRPLGLPDGVWSDGRYHVVRVRLYPLGLHNTVLCQVLGRDTRILGYGGVCRGQESNRGNERNN